MNRSAPQASTVTVAGTEPYPWPWDGLRPTSLALVLVGWDGHWASRAVDAAGTTAVADRLGLVVGAAGGLVVRVAHGVPPRAPSDVPPPTPLQAPPGHQLLAAGIDAFYGSGLDAWLRAEGRSQLLVAGHGLEGPVHSSLRSANDRGLECLLVVDACSSLQPDLVAGATSSVCMSGGIFGAVGRSADVAAALHAVSPPRPVSQEDLP